jgi:hypothetical protein
MFALVDNNKYIYLLYAQDNACDIHNAKAAKYRSNGIMVRRGGSHCDTD